MAWVLHRKNGKRQGSPFLFQRDDVLNLSRDKDNCYVLQNTGTHAFVRVGGRCRKKSPESAITYGAGMRGPGEFLEKLFGKKKPKRHPMSKRIMFVPGRGASPMSHRGELVTIGRARRKRRRRR